MSYNNLCYLNRFFSKRDVEIIYESDIIIVMLTRELALIHDMFSRRLLAIYELTEMRREA